VLLLALRETRLHSAGLVLRALPALARQRRGLFTPLSRRLASHGWPVACLVEPHQPLITLGSEVPQWVVEMPEPAQRPVSERPAG
jgi:hypothetical protein